MRDEQQAGITADAADRGRLARVVTSLGLALATAGALVIATFASEETVARLAICQTPDESSVAPFAYVGAVVLLVFLHWTAGVVTRRTAPRRGPATALIAVSAAGVLFSAFVAQLGLGFWGASADTTAAAMVRVGILFFVAFAAPSLGSLAAAILLRVAGTRPMPRLLPPLVVPAATTGSVVILLIGFAASCG